MPGYEAKKGMVIPSYLKVSNKLSHAYWCAHIHADFARLLRPTAWCCIFHLCSRGKRKTQTCWTYESIFCYHFCACKCRGSCFCRLTQPLRAQTIQSSPSLPVSGARKHASFAHVHFFFFLFLSSPEEAGAHYILWKIYELLQEPQLFIDLVVLLFVYFCIKAWIKWLKPGIIKACCCSRRWGERRRRGTVIFVCKEEGSDCSRTAVWWE